LIGLFTEGKLPKDVNIKDKSTSEKLQLIEQLEEEDKQALFHIIDTMLTKSKFKEFIQKNIGAL
jgi:hypothetical protein